MSHKSIPFYWRRAQKALISARILVEHGLYEDSISRSYYAVLHAALLVYNIKTHSHPAVIRNFGKYLITSGEIEKEWAFILSRENSFRSNADYAEQFEADHELARQLLQDADNLLPG